MNFFYMSLGLFTMLATYLPSEEVFVTDPSTKTAIPVEISLERDKENYFLNLTGLDTRTKLFTKVYLVAHYLQDSEKGTLDNVLKQVFDDSKAKQLSFFWLKNVDSKIIKDNLLTSFKKVLGPKQFDALKNEIYIFLNLYNEDVTPNEQQFLRWFPGGIVEIEMKSRKIITITNEDFAKALWNIWLGPKSNVNRKKLLQFAIN